MSIPAVASRAERGFSVIEMLVSTAIMVSVTGAIFSVMNPAHGIFAAQPEKSDMQQRMRIGVDTLYKDLVMAGAGTTRFRRKELSSLLGDLVFIGLFAFVAWGRFGLEPFV